MPTFHSAQSNIFSISDKNRWWRVKFGFITKTGQSVRVIAWMRGLSGCGLHLLFSNTWYIQCFLKGIDSCKLNGSVIIDVELLLLLFGISYIIEGKLELVSGSY
jgi:hypothetical protein